MSTDEKDDVPAPELTAFDGDDAPLYDLSDLDGEDEEAQVHEIGATDEESPVHDLGAADDLGADEDVESLVQELVADDEPEAHDLGTDDGEELPVHNLGTDDTVEPPVHDLGTEGEDHGSLVDDIEPGTEKGTVHSLDAAGDKPVEVPGDDTVPVFDLSSSADRQAVLAEALAHAATVEAQYQQPLPETKKTGTWKAPLALVVFTLSAYLLVFPTPWLAGSDPPTVSQTDREQGVRAALFLQAQQVEVFRVRQGRLPNSLDEIEGALEGIQFIRSNNRIFQLVAPGFDGPNIIYDSSRPIDEFTAAAAGWGVARP